MKHRKNLRQILGFTLVVVCLGAIVKVSVVHSQQISGEVFWRFRQPPYEVSGWFPTPGVTAVTWGGDNFEYLYVNTKHLDDSPYADGIYRSKDKGLTWEHLGWAYPEQEDAVPVTVWVTHPLTPTIMLAGSDDWSSGELGWGLYRSVDGGETWSRAFDDLGLIHDIEFDPSNPNRIYVSGSGRGGYTKSGVYRSDDSGVTWQQVSQYFAYVEFEDIDIHPTQPNVMFGSRFLSTQWGEGIYRSDDGGKTWRQLASKQLQHPHILINDYNPNEVFTFGNYGGIWRSDNGGETWVDVSSGLPSPIGVQVINVAQFDPIVPNRLWVGLKYIGMFFSDDSGTTWQLASNGMYYVGTGLNGNQCSSIAMRDNEKYAVACNYIVYVRIEAKKVFLPLLIKQ